MNLDFVAPTQILNLTIPFCAQPRGLISCHFSNLCQRGPISLYMLINARNKCNSKYIMKSATRMQVVELWPIKCGSFCARIKIKAATWLQEDKYSEWVMGLHWINIRSKGLYKGSLQWDFAINGLKMLLFEEPYTNYHIWNECNMTWYNFIWNYNILDNKTLV
jgi:hypothetical protein